MPSAAANRGALACIVGALCACSNGGAVGGSGDAAPADACASMSACDGGQSTDASDAARGEDAGAPDGPRSLDGASAEASGDGGVAMCLPASIGATDFFVSTSGSDGSDGSAGHPWATISHAATVVGPGATVHVLAGTYRENVVTRCNGNASARIRFISECRWAARIAPSGSTSPVWLNGQGGTPPLEGNYVDIIGFEIDGSAGSAAVGIENLGSYARSLGNHVHHIPAPTGCTDGNGGAGIDDANYGAQDDDIVGNLVHDIGGASIGSCVHGVIHGVYHSNLRGHVQNNVVYHVEGYGVHLWHAANNVVVTNNTVFNNGWFDGNGYVGGGIIIADGDSPGGVVNDDTTVSNNIVYKNGGVGLYEYGAVGMSNRYLNNLIFGNGDDAIFIYGASMNGVSADPLFVDFKPLGGGDYRLMTASPAVDVGTTACAPSTQGCAPALDFAGGSRAVDPRIDLGAFERGAPPAGWSWY
jgi:hypothetical protein